MNITEDRAKIILDKYARGQHDLFNWCQEFKDFVNDSTHGCVSSEIDYIIKKSYEDDEAPISYEDLEQAKDKQISEESIKERMKDGDLDYQDAKDELFNETDVYEWHVISDPLLYRLEKQGEIILNGLFWGRQTTGQSIQLDHCVIKAFIDILNDRVARE